MATKQLLMKIIKKRFDDLTEAEIIAWRKLTSRHTPFNSPFYQYDFTLLVSRCDLIVDVILGLLNNEIVFILPVQYKNGFNYLIGYSEKIAAHLADYSGGIVDITQNLNITMLPIQYTILDHMPELSINPFSDQVSSYQELSSQIILETTWQKMASKIDNEFLNEIHLNQANLEKNFGSIQFKFQNENIENLECLLFAINEECIERKVISPFKDKWTVLLLRQLFLADKKEVKPIMSTLFAGNRWIASMFGIEANGVLHYWFYKSNPSAELYSPLNVLICQVIKASVKNNLACIDLGFGQKQFKEKLCSQFIPLYKMEFVNNSINARAIKLVNSFLWKLK